MFTPLSRIVSLPPLRISFARKLLMGLLLAGLVARSGLCLAQEPEEDLSEVGLNGIIGEPPSPELDTQFLAMDLPESWKDWAEALDEEMLVYLFPEELDVQGQRELIEKLRKRVRTMQLAIADPRYRPIRDRLLSLAGPLDRHLELSAAILDALDRGVAPVSAQARQRAFVELQESAKTLNALLPQQPGGAEWNKTLKLPRLLEMLSDANSSAGDLRKLLEDILSAAEEREEYTADQLRFLRSDVFWAFQKSAARAHAILEWAETPANQKTLRETLKDLAVAAVSLDVNHLVVHAKDLQRAWDRLVLLNPANAETFAFLNEHYFSDNLHTFIAEKVLHEMIYERRTDSGQICETVMGAQVYGNQVTNTEVTIDLVPSPEEAQMAVKVLGDIQANTVGIKCQIKVYTQGMSQFLAVKQARFDGFRFQTYPAEIWVDANTIPYDAETPVSCLPLLGNCLDKMVLNQAIARKGDAEAITRQRVAERALPELNQGLDEGLSDANQELSGNIYRRLRNLNLYPVRMKTATTDTHFLSHTLIRNRAEVGGSAPPTLLNEPTGVNFQIHESLLNNIADRMNLAGRTMTDEDVRNEIERFIFELTGRQLNLEAPPPTGEEENQNEENAGPPDRFVFDKLRPIRFQIRSNELRITVRTALLRPSGEVIPPHDIMIPLRFQLEGEDIAITKGRLAVNRADGQGNPAQNLVMGKKISDAIPDGRRSRLIEIQLQDKTFPLRIERIKLLDGWASLWALPVPEEQQSAPTAETR